MRKVSLLCLAVGLVFARPASALPLIINGGFESGLTGWTVVNEVGGSGNWFSQTGTASALNGFFVAAPPEGAFAAMTDQGGPGSHVLYQDFLVPFGLTAAVLNFDLTFKNQGGAFVSPASLDALSGFANQQGRVDIMTTSADPFSVAAGDVLLNVFQTNPGDTLDSGLYTSYVTDLFAVLFAHQGETLRLRFAEADNQLFLAMGVDRVSLTTRESAPEPGTLVLLGTGLAALVRRASRRS